MTGFLHPHQERELLETQTPPSEAITADHTQTVGIPQERVDPYTLAVIDRLFPGHRGLQFLAGILRQAVAKQLALPDLGLPLCDVAVVTIQSLRVLARLIGWSYDTTEKYVVVFCQLRLLHKSRKRRQITLYFPLCPPRLPEPEALDELGDYRPKVRSFTNRVKRRFILLSKHGKPLPSSPTPSRAQTEQERGLPPVEALLEDIRRILHQEEKVDAETGSRLLLKIAGALQYRCRVSSEALQKETGQEQESPGALTVDSLLAPPPGHNSRQLPESGDFLEKTGDPSMAASHGSLSAYTKKSPAGEEQAQTGDCEPTESFRKSRPCSPKGDSLSQLATSSPSQSRQFSRTGDFSPHTEESATAQKSPISIQKGDPEAREPDEPGISPAQKSPIFTEIGDSHAGPGERVAKNGRLSAQTDDSDDEADSLNVNVSLKNILFLLNVNVKPVIEYLRRLFGDPPTKRGYYYHLHKQCQDADTWLAATLETLLAIHRQRTDVVENPGGYFYKRCLALSREGISTETKRLVQLYGPLSYPQLLEALQKKPSLPAQLSRPSAGPGHPPGAGVPIAGVKPLHVKLPRPAKDLPGMPPEQLKAIIKEVRDDAHTHELQLHAFRQKDGTGILLIEDILGRQQWICSQDAWKRCRSLISRSILWKAKGPASSDDCRTITQTIQPQKEKNL